MENWSVKANERQRWQRLHWSLLAGSLVAALATGFAVSLDQNSSEWLRGFKVPGDLRKAISLSEVFAHGFGVAAILGTLLFLSEQNRRSAIWGAILITFVAGGTANILKGGFVRIRPHSVGQIEVVDASALAATGHGERTGEAEVVKASFWDARQRSFPSGHAATACGLAIGLSLVFPKGAGLFAFFAMLACIQRISSGAHYLTDVLAGVAVALLCSLLLLSLPPVRRWFTV